MLSPTALAPKTTSSNSPFGPIDDRPHGATWWLQGPTRIRVSRRASSDRASRFHPWNTVSVSWSSESYQPVMK